MAQKANLQYQYYDLGELRRDQIIEVGLGYTANVRILDSPNYSKFKSGRSHRYIGGYVTQSPYYVVVPENAHWYAVIDLGGYSGKIKSYVKVLSGKLPPAIQ